MRKLILLGLCLIVAGCYDETMAPKGRSALIPPRANAPVAAAMGTLDNAARGGNQNIDRIVGDGEFAAGDFTIDIARDADGNLDGDLTYVGNDVEYDGANIATYVEDGNSRTVTGDGIVVGTGENVQFVLVVVDNGGVGGAKDHFALTLAGETYEGDVVAGNIKIYHRGQE